MPFIEQHADPAAWARRARRVLVNGPPNTWKTSSLATWPGPLVVVSYPGEKGTTSIPVATRDGHPVTAYVWDGGGDGVLNWTGVLAEVQKITFEALKSGKYATFAGDGLHKLYDIFLNAVTSGAKSKGEDFDPKKYGAASSLFLSYIDRVMASDVGHVVMTAWTELEKDDPDEKGREISRHYLPRLPGKLAMDIMGEFSVVLYAIREGAGPATRFSWQTAPIGRVWGAGAKVPSEIAARLPIKVPQDWAALEKVLIPSST